MKYIVVLTLTTLVGCGQPTKAPEEATQRLPTATEVFNLRAKCVELSQKVDAENVHGSAVMQDVVSNYNTKNGRCYVTLENHPSINVMGTAKWYDEIHLYDGQTRELLAYVSSKGSESSQKNGMVFSKDVMGYDEAQAFIARLMQREE